MGADIMKCPVTGREDMIDDCYIKVEFGYGSDKDLMTYRFGPVHDMVGKTVLDVIQSFMDTATPPITGNVEDFGVNEMEEYFTKEWGQEDEE